MLYYRNCGTMFSCIQIVIIALLCSIYVGYVECQAGECRNATTCPCCKPETCPSDGSGQCGGNCIDGYHGGKCWNKCPSNCSRCEDDSLQGNGAATCTHCKEGYYSTSNQCQMSCSSNCTKCDSDTHCTKCRDAYYLASNQCHKCNDTCLTCNSWTSCTSCHAGYFRDTNGACKTCHQLCSTCTSHDRCTCSVGCSSNLCIDGTDLCTLGCKANFTNPETCDSCVEGQYGYQCNRSCSVNCNTTCDRGSGVCSACKPGYHGAFCNISCPAHCLSTCNRTTGNCNTCMEGYHGDDCSNKCETNCKECTLTGDTCVTCVDGFYGDKCGENCSKNCLIKTCDKIDGSCECAPGYAGDVCQNKVTTTTKSSTVKSVIVTAEPAASVVGPAVGGTIGGVVIIIVLVLVIVILLRRRGASTYKGQINQVNLDDFKLDTSKIDILEENDEFGPTYFTGTVDDTRKPCGKLPVKELVKFVDSHDEDFYQEEFLKLPRGLIKSCDEAKKDENIIKNRYNGVYPYDEHRVKLLPPGSDFINACFIDGYKKKKEYIASLGPTMKAMGHFEPFWRMVWQEKTDIIVMVTNLMEGQSMKCEQYWPKDGKSECYGDIMVKSAKEYFYAEFVERVFIVSKDGEERVLHHVHYTAWLDKRIPNDITSLIEFRQKLKTIRPVLGGPIIVHCSAGIGRTGTYIALDILIQQGKDQKSLDIFEWVTNMRQQRTSMVQTWQQYEYLHHALVHALTYHCDPIKAKKFRRFMDGANDKGMTKRFKQLQKAEQLQGEEQEAREMNKGFEGMNRDGADIPGNLHRPFLHLEKKFGECNYINAVFLSSFSVKNRFLIAQTPLPETVKDFLTLITQESCSCIVSMDPPGLRDQTIGEYFTSNSGEVFTLPSHLFEVEAQQLDSNPSYVLRKLIIRHNSMSGSTSRTVYHFQCHHWPQGNQVPNVTLFLQLVQDVEAMADRDMDRGPVLVHCLNAAGRSGLFCAVSNLIQKMRLEEEVSMVNTLRQVKVRCPLAIPNKAQYVFCHESVLQFVKSDNPPDSDLAVYANV